MPHEQLLWQAPGFLVSFCSAREGNTRREEEAYSPFLPSCMRARASSKFSPSLRILSVFQRACSQASKTVEKQ